MRDVGSLPAPETPDFESEMIPRSAIHEISRYERRERENHRRCIAAGIGHQGRAGNPVSVQLRQAVNGVLGEFSSFCGIGVMKAVRGAMLLLFEPPCAAEIDDSQPSGDGFGDKFPRGAVRRGQEQKLRFMLLQLRPGKRFERQMAVSGDMGEGFRQVTVLPRFRAAPQE